MGAASPCGWSSSSEGSATTRRVSSDISELGIALELEERKKEVTGVYGHPYYEIHQHVDLQHISQANTARPIQHTPGDVRSRTGAEMGYIHCRYHWFRAFATRLLP